MLFVSLGEPDPYARVIQDITLIPTSLPPDIHVHTTYLQTLLPRSARISCLRARQGCLPEKQCLQMAQAS